MLKIGSVVIRVDDLEAQAEFWQAALGYDRRSTNSDVFAHLYSKDGDGPDIALDALRSEAQVPPRIHLDLFTGERHAEVARLKGLGATEIPWENRPADAAYTVMADPEGNRFCIIDA